MATSAELIARHEAALTGNYGKLPVVLSRGHAATVWDAGGKEYIDFFAGFGGTILGHCHPRLVDAITKQAQTLWQVGNQFYSEPQIRLAEHLKAKAFDGRVFFCHSGAEAAEAAIKLARLFGGSTRPKIVTMQKGFHGRTMGALSATAGPAQNGFAPLVPGFVHVPYDNLEALEEAVDGTTSAVMLEPIQGEGGINEPTKGYLRAVRELCHRCGALLIFDEVWTGVGRTGHWFGHQISGVIPDIMTMGKALGGGIPVGGILAQPQLAALLKPGTHGCTLGGNPICAAVSATVFDVIEQEKLLDFASNAGAAIRNYLSNSACKSRIKTIRGAGLFIGVELVMPDALPVVRHALDHGLIINVTQKNVLRICPSLVITEKQIQQALAILEKAIMAV
jgi:predicted acetylornithine/succinylornithine family transaminase